ncbi:hypothetical protein HHI36_000832 [Cryptolaemus montrouzieri]|uniref:Lipocalin/cytosolic fatty-acid binding domain-containing protein n=1 Tax=Cryptolaemus montrouzieri TaxID=559131 RepID=A0ABD2P612_9CUCU
MFKYSVLIFIFFHNVNCQVPIVEKCPDVSIQQNFDMPKWTGTWYLEESYFTNFLEDGKCVELLLSPFPNGTVGVHLTQINIKTEEQNFLVGDCETVGPNGEAEILGSLYGTFFINSTFVILETDYDTYSVNWACQEEIDGISNTLVWIFSRTPKPSNEIIKKCHNILDKNGITRRYLNLIDQEDCPNKYLSN